MKLQHPKSKRKLSVSARALRMRDTQFDTVLTGLNGAIVQRRSGKTRLAGVGPLNRLLPIESCIPAHGFSEPAKFFRSGKLAAQSLACFYDGEQRLEFARTFCRALIQVFWLEIQRDFRSHWPLPEQFAGLDRFKLDPAAVSLTESLGTAAARIDPITASYLIGRVYTALIPDEMRSRLGVYYTPPGLTRRLLDSATAAGVNWQSCRVLDPACGGGAFLAPVAARIAAENRSLPKHEIIKMIAERVRGFEIDPFSGWTSQVFLEATLMSVCRQANERLPIMVEICNSLLRPDQCGVFDLVIGNPPYGRVTLASEIRDRFRRSLFGHANLYGLFTDLAVRLTKPGGVIAFVTPTSFLAGEYFKSLRRLLAEEAQPANIDFVSDREGVFDDALQETLLATYKRGAPRNEKAAVNFISSIEHDRVGVETAGTFSVPESICDPWLIPRDQEQEAVVASLRTMRHRLRDYGYEVSTGPLVWNRHKSQLSAIPVKGALPLIWAESVTTDGQFRFRAKKKNHEPYFVPSDRDEWLISRNPCVLLQRTTAKEQQRRLIAAELPRRFLAEHGPVVIENHLNMLRPINGTPPVPPKVMAAFLNTRAVDSAFRCLSGSVAVSAYELEALPLPPPERLAEFAKLVKARAPWSDIERSSAALFQDSGDTV
jgi:adenine-specific DNA-methyltransferase